MHRIRIALAFGAAALALALLGGTAAAATPKLTATVGSKSNHEAFVIGVTQNGQKVTKLKAGKYAITVIDYASTHNFHLVGPGVNKTTSVGGTGTVVWTVTLKKGTYKYQCDPHFTSMKGSFTVS
jgi:plastocyanin